MFGISIPHGPFLGNHSRCEKYFEIYTVDSCCTDHLNLRSHHGVPNPNLSYLYTTYKIVSSRRICGLDLHICALHSPLDFFSSDSSLDMTEYCTDHHHHSFFYRIFSTTIFFDFSPITTENHAGTVIVAFPFFEMDSLRFGYRSV
jgi:hypothetical protein